MDQRVIKITDYLKEKNKKTKEKVKKKLQRAIRKNELWKRKEE